MTRVILASSSFISAILFPWPLTVIFALAASVYEPLIPLAAGLFVDTLYYVPQDGAMPLFTLYGALATTAAFLMRDRLKTGIIRG